MTGLFHSDKRKIILSFNDPVNNLPAERLQFYRMCSRGRRALFVDNNLGNCSVGRVLRQFGRGRTRSCFFTCAVMRVGAYSPDLQGRVKFPTGGLSRGLSRGEKVRELFQDMEGQTQRNSATDSIVWMEEDEPACCIVEKPWRYEFSRAFYLEGAEL